jgi:hypothetical protein
LIVALQAAGGAYASGFGGYPDEPAHAVTSLMMRDFIAGLDFRHHLQFAPQYFLHYPKVAIGYWPPIFYGALGIWFLIFDASRGTTLIFIAVVAATKASIIYLTGKRLIGRLAGVLAAALFVSPAGSGVNCTRNDRASFNSGDAGQHIMFRSLRENRTDW